MSRFLRMGYDDSGFMKWWVGSSLFVYPFALLLGTIGLFTLGFLSSLIRVELSGFMTIPIFPFMGGIIGWSMGFLQRRLLRKYLFWTADRWLTYSAIGGAIGGLAVGILVVIATTSYIYNPYYTGYYNSYTWSNFSSMGVWAMPIFVGFVSLIQYFSLRQAVSNAWLWVFANVISGMVFVGLVNTQSIRGYGNISELLRLAWVLFVPASQGFVTGITLLFLFKRFGYPIDHQLAYVPIPIETNTNHPRKPFSVWDDAI